MIFTRLFSLQMKDIFKRKTTQIVFLFSIAYFLLGVAVDFVKLYHKDVIQLFPGWYYMDLIGMSSGEYITQFFVIMYLLFFMAFLTPLIYSDCYFNSKKNGFINVLMTRTTRKNYFLSSGLSVFVSSFLVVFIPLCMIQLLFWTALPDSLIGPVTFSYAFRELDSPFHYRAYFPGLAANHTYLFNIFISFLIAFAGSLVAELSFSISLYWKRSKFLILTFLGFLNLIAFIIPTSNQFPHTLLDYLLPGRSGNGATLPQLGVFLLVLSCLCAIAICGKIKFVKDEL